MTKIVYFLGIDLGRKGLGLVLLDQQGDTVATLRRAYGGRIIDQEHDPQDWWRAVRTGVKEMLRRSRKKAEDIRCIGLTGPSDAAVLLDSHGKVLSPAILGPRDDLAPYLDDLRNDIGARNLSNLAGSLGDTACPAVKLLWVRDHAKRVWHDLAMVLQPRDFLRLRLCGTRDTDPSTASGSLLFNPRARSWSKQMIGQLDFDPAWLPSVHQGTHISGRVSAVASRETGLPAGTPVITGGSHRSTTAVAVGAIEAGDAMVELGGTGTLMAILGKPKRDLKRRLDASCHCLDERWTLEHDHLTSEDTIDWFLQQVAPAELQQARRNKKAPLDQLAELAAEIPPGSDGLCFIPPEHGNPGGYLGLSFNHSRGHLIRATLEAGALAVAASLPVVEEHLGPLDHLRVAGPGADNNLWCQILSDTTGRPIRAYRDHLIAGRGAALLAASAIGVYQDLAEVCTACVKHDAEYAPRSAATRAYRDLAPLKRSLVDALAGIYTPDNITVETH